MSPFQMRCAEDWVTRAIPNGVIETSFGRVSASWRENIKKSSSWRFGLEYTLNGIGHGPEGYKSFSWSTNTDASTPTAVEFPELDEMTNDDFPNSMAT